MPAQPTAPARQRRFWQNRNFQGVLLFPVVIALLYWIDGRRGDQAWVEYKAWAVGRGIKLYQSDYERLAIPDEENYAAASFIVEMGNEANSDDVVKRLKLPSLYLRSPTEWKAVRRDPLLGWQKAFVREKWIPSAGDDPAADVLTALERLDGSLSQVRAASQRPMSQWPAQLDEIGRQRFPYLMPLLAATNALNLRSQALLAQHRGEEALAEIRHSLRAARSLEHEETVIPYLLRTTIWIIRWMWRNTASHRACGTIANFALSPQSGPE